MRRARIVCTIGPATGSRKMLKNLLTAGMDVARLNMSHGSREDHASHIARLRSLSRELGRPVGILMDLQGIKLRISEVEGTGVVLKKNTTVRIRQSARPTTAETIHIPYPGLVREVKKGHRVLINDGLVELRITGKEGKTLLARVEQGGLLTSRKGVNLPESDLRAGNLTAKDIEDLAFGVEQKVDAFALSYVADSADILAAKKRLSTAGYDVPVIAKIERPKGVENIEEILDAADGIMVARGDLGVEMPASSVPILQKDLIRRANGKRRLIITATQMLESMTERPVPTRAESADVANAILDGTDAVMLSAETSVGKFPVKAVRTMVRIILETEEKGRPFRAELPVPDPCVGKGQDPSSFAVADAAVRAAQTIGGRCIAAVTRSGYTAGLLAKFRPQHPIVAFTPRPEVINQLKLHWGVVPFLMKHLENTDIMIDEVERTLVENRQAKRGDDVIITASLPMAATGKTNFLKIHRVGNDR